jgi:uncharacterized protein (TIGR02453 family)
MSLKATFKFLKSLKTNNNREWMQSHKAEYELAKNEVLEMLSAVLLGAKSIDKRFPDIPAESCMFRINRDVRFSKNKDPYKTNFGAAVNLYGKKSVRPGFYIHLEPGGVFLAAGVFQPPNDVLNTIRKEIEFNHKVFLKIISSKTLASMSNKMWEEDKLQKVPKGFDSESPVAEYLKLKSHILSVSYADKQAIEPDFPKKIASDMKALWPYITFIDQSFH